MFVEYSTKRNFPEGLYAQNTKLSHKYSGNLKCYWPNKDSFQVH